MWLEQRRHVTKAVVHVVLFLSLRLGDLLSTGVRWVYRGHNNKFSNDLEPKHVTLNVGNTKAYVGIQVISFVCVSIYLPACLSVCLSVCPVSYTHLTLPTNHRV